jgi:hypothetical protein
MKIPPKHAKLDAAVEISRLWEGKGNLALPFLLC